MMQPVQLSSNLNTPSMICTTKKGSQLRAFSWRQGLLPLVLSIAIIFCSSAACCYGQNFQLATPMVKYASVFFDSAATVQMRFNQPGTSIYYTLDGQTPSVASLRYTGPVTITKSFTTIKAIAAAKGFRPSAEISATFIQNGAAISDVNFPAANEKYAGSGPTTLTDNKGGLPGTGAGTWLGYQQDSVEIMLLLQQKQPVQQVLVDCLQDHGSWIFLPQQIRVYYFDEDQEAFLQVASKSFAAPAMVEGASCKPLLLPVDKSIETDQLKIVITGTPSIPAWHPGKGEKGWLFIDEIKVY